MRAKAVILACLLWIGAPQIGSGDAPSTLGPSPAMAQAQCTSAGCP